MSENLEAETRRTPTAAKLVPYFVLAGLTVVGFVLAYGIFLSTVAADYYALTKAARDGAEAGSAALGQLELLKSAPAWLEPLKFVGLVSLLAGIGLSLYSIVTTLRVRGRVMAATLAEVLEGK